jgi:hypothetical protein
LHRQELGKHFEAYNNHVYRVYNLACQHISHTEDYKLVAIAAAYHDLGIWTHNTFDYLTPSITLAKNHGLKNALETESIKAIEAMIDDHHRIHQIFNHPLSEIFRQADITDLTFGIIHFKNHPAYIRLLKSTFPNKGFHVFLVKIFIKNLFKKPWKPLPMFKW